MPGQASGSFDADETLPRRQATAGGGVAHVRRDGLEAALDRLDDERNVRDRGCEQQTLEGERQRLAGHGLKRLAERRPRAEGHEQVEPQHRRGQHERHGDERFDEQLAWELSNGQQAPQPDAATAAGGRSCRRPATETHAGPSSPWRLLWHCEAARAQARGDVATQLVLYLADRKAAGRPGFTAAMRWRTRRVAGFGRRMFAA